MVRMPTLRIEKLLGLPCLICRIALAAPASVASGDPVILIVGVQRVMKRESQCPGFYCALNLSPLGVDALAADLPAMSAPSQHESMCRH